jgi:RNA polymerase sigma-70 factor (ECF subfamily)
MVVRHFASYIVRGAPSHVTSEKALLKRAKAYDSAALAELYDRYAPRMYSYIYRRVSDAALAEDLTSELFLRMLRAIQNERAWRDSFVAWLYRIAHNLVVDVYRRQDRLACVALDEGILPPAEDDPVQSVQDAEAQAKVRAAICQLTPEQQEVLALRFGEELTARETGHVLQKTTGAVEALQRRALAALRRMLAGETSA